MHPFNAAFSHADILHPLFETLGLAGGFQYYRALKRRSSDPLPQQARFWIVVAAAIGAGLGARTTALIEALFAPAAAPGLCHSEKSIVGALVIGLFTVEVAKMLLGVRRSSGDLFTYPTIFGLVVGRIGCFLGGLADCTYGDTTSGIFAVDFGDGLGRHPAQLYEIAALLSLAAALHLWERRARPPEGARFKIFLVFYLAYRLIADAFKPMIPVAPGGIVATQVLCLVGLFWYCGLLARTMAVRARRPAQ